MISTFQEILVKFNFHRFVSSRTLSNIFKLSLRNSKKCPASRSSRWCTVEFEEGVSKSGTTGALSCLKKPCAICESRESFVNLGCQNSFAHCRIRFLRVIQILHRGRLDDWWQPISRLSKMRSDCRCFFWERYVIPVLESCYLRRRLKLELI